MRVRSPALNRKTKAILAIISKNKDHAGGLTGKISLTLGEDPLVQRRSVANLVSESLIRGNCPVDAVVIPTSSKGDRTV